jgi:hypothetical protein
LSTDHLVASTATYWQLLLLLLLLLMCKLLKAPVPLLFTSVAMAT